MMAEGVCCSATLAFVWQAHWDAQPQSDANPEHFVWEEKAELFHGESVEPRAAVRFSGCEEAGTVQLTASLEEGVQAFSTGDFVEETLLEGLLSEEMLVILGLDEVGENGKGGGQEGRAVGSEATG